MFKRWHLPILLLLMSLTKIPSYALEQPLTLESQRIVFSIDKKANTTTMVVSYSLTGGNNKVYAFFAVPKSPLKIDTIGLNGLDFLDYWTNPNFNEPNFTIPYDACLLFRPDGGESAQAYYLSLDQEPTKILDYSIVRPYSFLKDLGQFQPLHNPLILKWMYFG